MPGLYYRLSETVDPEERLEDASLWKCLSAVYGAGIAIVPSRERPPEGAIMFGRGKHFEGSCNYMPPDLVSLPYWKDPGFLAGISRRFELCDLERAGKVVAELHSEGKDAFVKAADRKLMTVKVPVGTDLEDAIGDYVWSFIDRPSCLMVQEYVEMSFEHRFVVIDRKVVTHSPVQTALTPLSRIYALDRGMPIESLHFPTPLSESAVHNPALTDEMLDHVGRILPLMDKPHAIVDVAFLENDARIETIEFNPLQIGMFGLYACDPRAIAQASPALLPEDFLAEVWRRKEQNDPLPFVATADRSFGNEVVAESDREDDIWCDL